MGIGMNRNIWDVTDFDTIERDCDFTRNVGCMWQEYEPQIIDEIIARQGSGSLYLKNRQSAVSIKSAHYLKVRVDY